MTTCEKKARGGAVKRLLRYAPIGHEPGGLPGSVSDSEVHRRNPEYDHIFAGKGVDLQVQNKQMQTQPVR